MKKIPTVFERDWNGDRSRVIDQVRPGCEWVLNHEGVATIKLDGACCMVRDGALYKRRELRSGDATPPEFEVAGIDDETGKTVGWVPVGDGPEDKWFRVAGDNIQATENGTYEAVGPHFQGNPENLPVDVLMRHGECKMANVPRSFAAIREYLEGKDIEGIVFHHPDGRMAKIKLRDFGLKRRKQL